MASLLQLRIACRPPTPQRKCKKSKYWGDWIIPISLSIEAFLLILTLEPNERRKNVYLTAQKCKTNENTGTNSKVTFATRPPPKEPKYFSPPRSRKNPPPSKANRRPLNRQWTKHLASTRSLRIGRGPVCTYCLSMPTAVICNTWYKSKKINGSTLVRVICGLMRGSYVSAFYIYTPKVSYTET